MASQLARIFFIDHRIRTRKKVTIKEIVVMFNTTNFQMLKTSLTIV